MKKMKTLMRALLLVLCFAMVISLSACTADMSIGDNTELGKHIPHRDQGKQKRDLV